MAETVPAKMLKMKIEWNDLFWLIAENDVLKYKEIKALEVSVFFSFLEKWKKATEEKIKLSKRR